MIEILSTLSFFSLVLAGVGWPLVFAINRAPGDGGTGDGPAQDARILCALVVFFAATPALLFPWMLGSIGCIYRFATPISSDPSVITLLRGIGYLFEPVAILPLYAAGLG